MVYTTETIKRKKSKIEKVRKILNFIFFPLVLLIFLLILYVGYEKFVLHEENINFLGFRFFVVMTGSMEPNYNRGDLIVVKETPIQNLKVGDVINYVSKNSKNTVTHRITEIVQENGEKSYKTKGDNNNSVDSELVEANQIQGVLLFKISKVGALISKMLTGTGIVIIFLLVFISYIRSSKREEKRMAREDARKHYNIAKYEKEDRI